MLQKIMKWYKNANFIVSHYLYSIWHKDVHTAKNICSAKTCRMITLVKYFENVNLLTAS